MNDPLAFSAENFKIVTFLFDTEAEAEAFTRGIDYVNDGSLNIEEYPYQTKDGSWAVEISDEDGTSDDNYTVDHRG